MKDRHIVHATIRHHSSIRANKSYDVDLAFIVLLILFVLFHDAVRHLFSSL